MNAQAACLAEETAFADGDPESHEREEKAEDFGMPWMERVRSGSEEAAREMFDRYSGHIALVVRRRLDQRMRSQYDSLDFLQAV